MFLANLFRKKSFNFFSNTFYLYLSHFSDYLIALIFLPFIARKVGVVELGMIGFSQTFGVFLTLFLEFGSSLIGVREVSIIKNNKKKIITLLGDVVTSKLLLVPFGILFSFFAIRIIPVFSEKPNYIIITMIGAIFQGLSPSWVFHGLEKMKSIALSKIFLRLSGFIIIIIFVKTPNDAWIVLTSYALTSFAVCIFLHLKIFIIIGKFSLSSFKDASNILVKSINGFAITILPVIYQSLAIISMSIFVSPTQLGYFYGANRIYKAFNSLFGPISQAFFPIISSSASQNRTKASIYIKTYLLFIVSLGLLFSLIILIFSKNIVFLILGVKFEDSIFLLKIFSLVLPLTAITNAFGRQWLLAKNKDFDFALMHLVSSFLTLVGYLFLLQKIGIIAIPLSFIIYEIILIIMISYFMLRNGKFKISQKLF